MVLVVVLDLQRPAEVQAYSRPRKEAQSGLLVLEEVQHSEVVQLCLRAEAVRFDFLQLVVVQACSLPVEQVYWLQVLDQVLDQVLVE